MFVIEVRDTSIPLGVADMIEQLPDAEHLSGDDEITLRFSDRYVYRTGLVLLAAWRKTLPDGVRVTIDDSLCHDPAERLITNSGFRELIEDNRESPASYMPARVPIQPLIRGYSAERTISDICQIFERTVGSIEVRALNTLLSELSENTFVHSDFEAPGYIVAGVQAGANRQFCEVAIADSGIGILKSYLEGTNDEAKARIAKGASAIHLALDGMTSSIPTPAPGSLRSGRGLGLFIVRRLIEENGGRLTVLSGNECFTIEGHTRSRRDLNKPWRGTFVGLTINLDNPLPLDVVFGESETALIPERQPERPVGPPPEVRELRLDSFGSQLLTREIGVVIRAEVGTALASGSLVKVVLDGIEDLTPSVADESFGKLAESMGEEEFKQRISFVGGSPLLMRLIDFIVRDRLGKR